jgi:hypothetical protein
VVAAICQCNAILELICWGSDLAKQYNLKIDKLCTVYVNMLNNQQLLLRTNVYSYSRA